MRVGVHKLLSPPLKPRKLSSIIFNNRLANADQTSFLYFPHPSVICFDFRLRHYILTLIDAYLFLLPLRLHDESTYRDKLDISEKGH